MSGQDFMNEVGNSVFFFIYWKILLLLAIFLFLIFYLFIKWRRQQELYKFKSLSLGFLVGIIYDALPFYLLVTALSREHIFKLRGIYENFIYIFTILGFPLLFFLAFLYFRHRKNFPVARFFMGMMLAYILLWIVLLS